MPAATSANHDSDATLSTYNHAIQVPVNHRLHLLANAVENGYCQVVNLSSNLVDSSLSSRILALISVNPIDNTAQHSTPCVTL
jgi:hypothetical protein